MTRPDLDYLVRLARRDRPSSAMLEDLAHRLSVPLLVAPVAAAVLASSAFASLSAKLGLTRSLLAWSAGSVLAVTGGALALTLETSGPPHIEAPMTRPPVVASAASPRQPAPVLLEPLPEAESARPATTPSTGPERQKLRDLPARWDEPQLIERARKALGADPKQALALTQEYQRRFPSGALTVEREVIALEALARLGQRAEARRRARAFEAQHPTSIHLPRVRSLLARLDAP